MASTPSSEAAEGPVMTLFYKRLRSLKKKLTKIDLMEKIASEKWAKPFNAEQMEVLRSKPAIAAAISELERMQPAMAAAVAKEVALVAKANCNECQGKKTRSKNRSKRCQIQESQDKALAAAAVENYSFQLPVETILVQSEVDSVAPVQFQPKVEEPAVYQENGTYDSQSSYVEETPKVEEPAVYQENGTYDSQSSYVEEAPKAEEPAVYQENGTYDGQSCYVKEAPKVESQPEDLTTKDVSQTNSQEDDQNSGESEWTEINRNGSRRNFNNHRGRGGGRRGFLNGRGARGRSRGGGPYNPNGQRSQQNSENGNFYPRSYYNNKGRGGGKVVDNHGSGPQGVSNVVQS